MWGIIDKSFVDRALAPLVNIGVQKINISSDMKDAYFTKCREILATTDLWDPNAIYPECINEAKALIRKKMELFQSVGKASLYHDVKLNK